MLAPHPGLRKVKTIGESSVVINNNDNEDKAWLPRGESNEEKLTDYLPKDHEVIQQFLDDQHLVNPVENESSRERSLLEANQVNLIKTKQKLMNSRTQHTQYIQSKGSFAGHSQASN